MRFGLKDIKLIITCLIVFTSIQSCKLNNAVTTNSPEKKTSLHSEFTKATIINHTVDGCSWMIKLEDGKLLEPINLKDEFKKENLKVWIQYKHYENFSFCMAGEMISITAFEIRELE